MRHRFTSIIAILLLSGCGIMPGLQNPDMSRMRHADPSGREARIKPVLVRITPALVASRPVRRYGYRVAPGDVLSVSVWQHPEMTPEDMVPATPPEVPAGLKRSPGQNGFLVNPQGDIWYPLAGNVRVAGKTVDDIRSLLTHKLRKYLKHPVISVRVADFRGRRVYLLGEVKKPGFTALNDQPLSIMDAIATAGGFDPNSADPAHIFVIHGRSEHPEVFWLNASTPDALLLAEHFYLQGGDIVFVSSAPAARWNRIISQLLPTVQTIWYTNAIIRSDY